MEETILQKEFYSAREISIAGFIKNNKGNPNDYNFVLKEIKRGHLKSVDMNPGGKKPALRVYATDIIGYLKNGRN